MRRRGKVFDMSRENRESDALVPIADAEPAATRAAGSRSLPIPCPKTPEEEREVVERFLTGLEKLFSRKSRSSLQPFLITMEYCAGCQTCSETCDVFKASGLNELYRPSFRSEVVRRLYARYFREGGLLAAWQRGELHMNWRVVARIAQLAYRCNLCLRCVESCPTGADNALVTRELRRLFSEEMGITGEDVQAADG